ncbi:alpha-mannosidase 2C1-like [Ostrea edulis]|uniref:alpha-mannosidase 2C1-like n=1 Tax=Ostrea edulis TaxID=37623 RepID=UPI0024AFC6CF|nr:alpha-mannosidase 2C1-like [Ostrea edulis]XP_056016318.1 alpha-mannosidase 2C1-like [Ostrea edulis]XP_056016319.1 alpha-mannosidase 2C1-like [Ostrea edulis]
MEYVTVKNKRTTLERADKFISPIYFKDVNLRGRLYRDHHALKSLTHFAAPGRITYSQAIKGKFLKTEVGQSFGPTWATHWFHLEIDVPDKLQKEEVHLLWNSNTEALVWQDGNPVQGLSGDYERISFPLSKAMGKDQTKCSLYIEMACNGVLGVGKDSMIGAPDMNKFFTLSQAEIAVFDREAYDLILDVETLHDMAKHMTEENERGYQALYTMNQLINTIDLNDRSTYAKAHQIAERFFQQRNGQSQHVIYAMGHAHMDTAWLWPYAETVRKCARSWSCTIRLMEQFPDFNFTCSQAQQYEWVKQNYPGLYTQIKDFVKRGRFIPVGGTWVEMDGNLPSGEAFVRQFLYGQRYFMQEFNKKCTEFWLPDTFGYSPQLPQIMRISGISRFLTQKLSWSLVNKFPHHTFWWEGIDGSSVLSHFPPGDSYHMTGKVEEVLRTIKNFKDKGRSGRSVYLFGYGDGGNGPSEEMLHRMKRLKDVDGLPKVQQKTPQDFFSDIEREDTGSLCRWRGELYLELHNGTYTTHAKVKKMNRFCEFRLHDVDFLSSVANILSVQNKGSYKFPTEELLRLWKLLLLNQFHDVLPGTSIEMVYEDAHQHYKDIVTSCQQLYSDALTSILGGSAKSDPVTMVMNCMGWQRQEVVTIDTPSGNPAKKQRKSEEVVQQDSKGNILAMVTVPSYGYAIMKPLKCDNPCSIETKSDGPYVLRNEFVTAEIDHLGRITALTLKGGERNAMSSEPGCYGNQFVLYDDIPLYWDAWDVMDYHQETRKPLAIAVSPAKVLDRGPLRVSLVVQLKVSDQSYVEQVISLDAGSPYIRCQTKVEWHENRKFLKVEFPTSVHSMSATYDIQFGHYQRTNHNNTSWDWAQFEVFGHKWAALSEHNYGVAILNDSKYGYSTRDGVMRLSLLRSPKAPDVNADMGTHTFTYAVMPFQGTFQSAGVIQAAYELNNPLDVHSVNPPKGSPEAMSFFSVDNPQVILETIKKSEDSDNDLVLRLYECFGGHTMATLTLKLPFKKVQRCNGLEEILEDGMTSDLEVKGSNISLRFSPFQIISLRLKF